jgi:hypothetical protein
MTVTNAINRSSVTARRCQLSAECTIAVRTASNNQALTSSMAAQDPSYFAEGAK